MKVKQFFGALHQIENGSGIEDEMNRWLADENPQVKFITQSESNLKDDKKNMWNLTITIFYT